MKNIIENPFDIFLISETKIDSSFPNSQFSINGCRMFWRDRNYFGGGICLYVKDSIASKELNSHKENIDAEAIYLEINIRKRKWLIIGTYKPPSQNDSLFILLYISKTMMISMTMMKTQICNIVQILSI